MDKIIEELIKYGRIAAQMDLSPGISGNLSARCEDKIIITSSGSANGFLTEDDFSIIDFEGNVVEGNSKPSSEKNLHIMFYKLREDINSVFHCHSPYLTSFASSCKSFNINASPEMIYCFGHIPKAKYALPGSENLILNTYEFFKEHDVVLLENHGVIVGGKNVKNAYLSLELCESYAKMMIGSELLGGVKFLSPEEISKVLELRNI